MTRLQHEKYAERLPASTGCRRLPCPRQEFFEKNGEPLFSSHTLDLSEEADEENISICKSYLERMAPMKASDKPGERGKPSVWKKSAHKPGERDII